MTKGDEEENRSATLYVRVPPTLKEKWKREAERRQMSLSTFGAQMISAGLRDISVQFDVDESVIELRGQRNDLREELENARARIEYLENQVFSSERRTVVRYVEENPGVTKEEIGQRLADTIPERLADVLSMTLADELRREGNRFYPQEPDGEGNDA